MKYKIYGLLNNSLIHPSRHSRAGGNPVITRGLDSCFRRNDRQEGIYSTKHKIYTLTFLVILLAVSSILAQQQPQNEPTTAPKTGELD